jgi:hypothetical protein
MSLKSKLTKPRVMRLMFLPARISTPVLPPPLLDRNPSRAALEVIVLVWGVGVGVVVGEGVEVGDGVGDGEGDGVGEEVGVDVGVGDGDIDGLDDGEEVGVDVGVAVGVGTGAADCSAFDLTKKITPPKITANSGTKRRGFFFFSKVSLADDVGVVSLFTIKKY